MPYTDPATRYAIPDPVGADFNIESMRAIAQRYNATSFIDRQATTMSDCGMHVNPEDSRMQFGIATYQLPDGYTLTHSIASFYPKEAIIPDTPPIVQYMNVIDITLPYYVPHVIVTPRLNEGVVQSIISSDKPMFPEEIASRIQLEGDFSEFIDVYAPPGQDTTAFVYLAPDIMEIILTKASSFIIEFVENHIYIIFRPHKASVHVMRSGDNTEFTARLHEAVLNTGLQVADKLTSASRPEGTLNQPKKQARMPRPNIWKISVQTMVILTALILIPFTLPPLLFMIFMSDSIPGETNIKPFIYTNLAFIILLTIPVILLFIRYAKERMRMNRYRERYGGNVIIT